MTRQIIFIFAVLCTVQVRANIRPAHGDTVRCASLCGVTELFRPLQPSYLDGVVVPACGSGNWFVSVAGGATAFLGTPLGCEDLFGRVKPSYSLALGKWFTPSVGARISYGGGRFKDGTLSTQGYRHLHADLLWNILGGANAGQGSWRLAPFAGVGLLHHTANGHNPFALSYGVQGQYRVSKRISAVLELSNTTTFQDFDGYGRANRLGDHMLSLSAGLAFHIGKVGWKRPVDAEPYIRRNGWLTDYANALSEQNSRYAGQYDKDRRTLAELKKILAIEGLLDTYSHLFDDDDAIGRDSYPRNDYSGLNSLRARLKNRRWDGKSPLGEETPGQNAPKDSLTDSLPNGRDYAPDFGQEALARRPDSTSAEYLALLQSGRECIGSPVFFFFRLGTSHLTDASQSVNLDALARVALQYGLVVKVTGTADSATGTARINDALSASRADYIAAELGKRGVPADRIVKAGKGGIADYTPAEANRHTRVMLYFR